MDRILIVAAHPDDDILGCGGLLAKIGNEKAIRVIFIAEGSSCRFNVNELDSQAVNDKIAERSNFGIKALSMFGIADIEFNNLPCGRLDAVPILDINQLIEMHLEDFAPDTVLTHFEFDNSNDHRVVYNSVMMATRPGIYDTVKRVISYEVASSSEWNFSKAFQPNFFEVLDLTHVEKKIDAFSCYESEMFPYPHPRSNEGLMALARYRGMQTGVEFAEAYRVVRSMSI